MMTIRDISMTSEFQTPNLDEFPATETEKQVAEKHTRTRPIVVEGEAGAHTVWLVVGNQSFQINDYHTAEEASWVCWQLAKALISFREEMVR